MSVHNNVIFILGDGQKEGRELVIFTVTVDTHEVRPILKIPYAVAENDKHRINKISKQHHMFLSGRRKDSRIILFFEQWCSWSCGDRFVIEFDAWHL